MEGDEPVNNSDGLPKCPASIRKKYIVDLTVLQNLHNRERSTRQDSLDERTVLVGYGDGGRGRDRRRECLWGVCEFPRVNEPRVMIQREQPREVQTLLERQRQSREDGGGTYLDVFEGRDELLEVRILPHSKHGVLRSLISSHPLHPQWGLT